MSRGVLIAVAVILFLLLVVVDETSTVFVVDETEQAIVTEVGKYKHSITEPGLNFKIPLTQQVARMESRVLNRDTPVDNFLTLDRKKLIADPVSRWRIADPKTFYITVRDESRAQRRLDDIVKSEMRDEISRHNFGDIIGNARTPLINAVTERVRQKMKEFGIHVVDVRIKRADLPQEVQESVFQRMRAERDRVAKRYRAEGEEEAAAIRAEADREVTVVLAEAYEKSQKLRGEGDSLSIQIYADAFSKDPEFYGFVRSLEVYEATLGEETQLVLSSDSKLFSYLEDEGNAKE